MSTGLPDGWVEVTHASHGFSLRHPPDWRALQGQGNRPLVVVGPGPGPRPVVEAAAPLLPPAGDLDAYVALQLASLGRLLTDLRLLDEGPAPVGAIDGRRLLTTYRQGVYLLNLVVWTALAGDRALSLSGLCLATEYDRVEGTFESVAASVRLGPARPARSQ